MATHRRCSSLAEMHGAASLAQLGSSRGSTDVHAYKGLSQHFSHVTVAVTDIKVGHKFAGNPSVYHTQTSCNREDFQRDSGALITGNQRGRDFVDRLNIASRSSEQHCYYQRVRERAARPNVFRRPLTILQRRDS
ncbi:hypothetical protein J6590_107846 [Homalodisca vitripennis]|nr:hypothetical protein J6590_062279 [Homalodisca vitripennis]KAG8308525.1 hypothetical protein J6590_107846 [Homalodisca vitripennis]